MFLNLDFCGDLPDYFLHALFTFLLFRAGVCHRGFLLPFRSAMPHTLLLPLGVLAIGLYNVVSFVLTN